MPENASDRETARLRFTQPERELWQAFVAGDRNAFNLLLRPHLPSLASLARRLLRDRHLAEDLVQETLVRACQALPAFRGEASLRTWLLRILIRLSTEPSRFARGRSAEPLPDTTIPSTMEPWPEHAAAARELQDRVREGLERLPPRQRTALHLRAVEGMDYAGIAEVLSISNASARMLVLAARKGMADRLGEWLRP